MALSNEQISELLEPAVDGQPPYVAAPVSIAISLKRIADALCGSAASAGVVDGISQAITEGIFNASRR